MLRQKKLEIQFITRGEIQKKKNVKPERANKNQNREP
jgi:hypothetical protein